MIKVCFDNIVRLAAWPCGGWEAGPAWCGRWGYFRPRHSGSSVGNCLAPHCLFTAKMGGGSEACRAYPVLRNAAASPEALSELGTEAGGAEPAMTPKRRGILKQHPSHHPTIPPSLTLPN